MTCHTALIVTAVAGLIFIAVGIYAVHRQQQWLASQLRQGDHHE